MVKLRFFDRCGVMCAIVFAAGCGASTSNAPGGGQQGATVGGPGAAAGGTGGTGASVGAPGSTGVPGLTAPSAADGVPCNVATVISNNCTLCHSKPTSFSAPMSLMSYADFHAQAKTDPTKKVYELIPARINSMVIAKRMPPASQPALSPADLQVLDAWAQAGAAASPQSCAITPKAATGNGGTAGTGMVMGTAGAGGTMAPVGSPATTMGGASDKPIAYNDPMMKCYQFTAHAPGDKMQPFAVDTTPDKYTNFMFMPPWQGMMYARSFRAITGNMQVIHHWLFYKDSAAGTDGDVSPSAGAHPDGQLMNGWAPGGSDMYLDPDVGQEMPSDVAYTLETHHNNTTGVTAPDGSGIEVCVTPTVPANIASLSWLGTDAISGTMATGVCTPTSTVPIHIIGGNPHMHTKGIRQTVIITRANGMMETLHDQPFDFANQHSYADKTIIMPGDSLATTCYWNAPASFGEKTSDEMCYYFTLYYPKLSLTNGNPVGTLIHGPNTCL